MDTTAASSVSSAAGSGIPFWAVITIAICGTVILVTATVLPLVFLQRWRRRRRRRGGCRRRTLVIDGREMSVYRGGGGGGGSGDTSTDTLAVRTAGKLRKNRRRGDDGRGPSAGGWDSSSSSDQGVVAGWEGHLSLPPVLPMIRRASSGFLSVTSRRSLLFSSTSFAAWQGDGDGGGETTMSGAVSGSGGGGGGGGVGRSPHRHHRRTSNAWVDEDAIHGPEMNIAASPSSRRRKGKKATGGKMVKQRSVRRSWRRSLRDSWPLKSLSPTLPQIASFGSSFGSPFGGSPKLRQQPTMAPRPMVHDAPSTFRFQHHVNTLPPPHDTSSPPRSPPRQLPEPPRKALLAATNAAAQDNTAVARGETATFSGGGGGRGGFAPAPVGCVVPRDRGLSYYTYEATGDRPAPLRLATGSSSSPAARRAAPSAGSTLTAILRTTERRVVEGQQRGSLGSSASIAAAAVAGSSGGGRARSGTVSTVGIESTLVGSGSGGTPSPPKSNGVKKGVLVQQQHGTHGSSYHQHSRGDSYESMLSEADSLVVLKAADTSPEGGYFHGLSSPNKGSPPRKEVVRQQQQQQQQLENVAMLIDSPSSELSDLPEVDETTVDDDEDMPPRAKATAAAARRAPRDADDTDHDDPFVTLRDSKERRLVPGARMVHAFNDAPRLPAGPGPITLSFLRSDSPLSNISGNSRGSRGSPDLRGPRARPASPQRNSIASIASTRNSQHQRAAQTAPRMLQQQQQQQQKQQQHQAAAGAAICQPSSPTSAVSSTANLLLHQQHRRNLSTVADHKEDEPRQPALPLPLPPSSPAAKDSAGAGAGPQQQQQQQQANKRLSELRELADLRAKASSPTLGAGSRRLSFRDHTPDLHPPTVALPRVPSSYYETLDEEDAAGARRGSMLLRQQRRSSSSGGGGGELRGRPPSGSSLNGTDFGQQREKLASAPALGGRVDEDEEEEEKEKGKEGPLLMGGRRRSQTIRLVPPEGAMGTLPMGGGSSGSGSGGGRALSTVVAAAAHLRRMNSQISGHSDGGSSSGASVTGPAAAVAAGVGLSTLREDGTGRIVRPPRHREANRHYLALGRVPKAAGGSGGPDQPLSQHHQHHDKENVRGEGEGEGVEFKSWRVFQAGGKADGRALESHAMRRLRSGETSPERRSDEYDSDGFWIPSPVRRAARRG